jgi:hypothetical protein
MASIEVSYRDIKTFQDSQSIIGKNESFESNSSRSKLTADLREKLRDEAGRSTFDKMRESSMAHDDTTELAKDLAKGSRLPEDARYTIEVTDEQEAAFKKDLEPLKSIEYTVGREKFSSFSQQQNFQATPIIDPAKQVTLDGNGDVKVTPAVSPVELSRWKKAAELLGNEDASRSANSMIATMEKETGKSFAELASDPNTKDTPVISSEFENSDRQRLYSNMQDLKKMTRDLDNTIVPQLDQYRASGGKERISSSSQIALEPNEDGSLKLLDRNAPSDYHSYENVTPKEAQQWSEASQLLGQSDREKREPTAIKQSMVDIHNDGGMKEAGGSVRGDFKKSVGDFETLAVNNSENSYEVAARSSTMVRKDSALEQAGAIKAAFSEKDVAVLSDRQKSNPTRIVDLGQIKKTPAGLEVTPVKEFRALPQELQKARTDLVKDLAANKSGAKPEVSTQQKKSVAAGR